MSLLIFNICVIIFCVSIYDCSAITMVGISENFVKKHLASFSNPPSSKLVYKTQKNISGTFNRTINHIIYSENIKKMKEKIIKKVLRMINNNDCEVKTVAVKNQTNSHAKQNQTNKNNKNYNKNKLMHVISVDCSFEVHSVANGIVWSKFIKGNPISCDYSNFLTVKLGCKKLGSLYLINHVFDVDDTILKTKGKQCRK
ncbi:hypothetical protein DPMN_069340 [Dreissena polymorpha]|uniref:Uncharacterized protein n=1 Tax=Dreissena polymorpha TaxID=45954 RepID=A0A9D3YYX3_DREPO|nr:hypothetical protein DPMN_069340 [Dreissena polymorpha]